MDKDSGAPAQKPSVGRMVHFHPPAASEDKGQPYPAVITHVWGDECVNLFVFNDYTNGLPDSRFGSVMRGDGPGQWNWPPRV